MLVLIQDNVGSLETMSIWVFISMKICIIMVIILRKSMIILRLFASWDIIVGPVVR